MMMEVRPSVALLSALMMLFSVMESRLEVASSNTRMGEFFRMALAIATRCFSPPDKNAVFLENFFLLTYLTILILSHQPECRSPWANPQY